MQLLRDNLTLWTSDMQARCGKRFLEAWVAAAPARMPLPNQGHLCGGTSMTLGGCCACAACKRAVQVCVAVCTFLAVSPAFSTPVQAPSMTTGVAVVPAALRAPLLAGCGCADASCWQGISVWQCSPKRAASREPVRDGQLDGAFFRLVLVLSSMLVAFACKPVLREGCCDAQGCCVALCNTHAVRIKA